MSPDVSQCLPSTPNDSNSRSLLPNQTPKDPTIFECPVYINQKRGGTYVFLATMTNKDLISKWVMTATAVMMQTDS